MADETVAFGATDRDVVVATGGNFPDALAAGPAAVARGGVLVMVDGTDLDNSTHARDWFQARNEVTRWVSIAGGTAAISLAVEEQIATILS